MDQTNGSTAREELTSPAAGGHSHAGFPLSGDRRARIDEFGLMAQHKGACDALLRACRLLRLHDMREAADLLIEHVPALAGPIDQRQAGES